MYLVREKWQGQAIKNRYVFLSSFQRGTTFTTFCFGFLGDEVFPNRDLLLKERICCKRRRSFLYISIPTGTGQNENGRVTSPESVSIHLTSDVVTLKCHTTYNYGAKECSHLSTLYAF